MSVEKPTVAIAVVACGAEYILQKRLVDQAVRYEFPGGKIEETDEDSKSAAAREFREETGIELGRQAFRELMDNISAIDIDGRPIIGEAFIGAIEFGLVLPADSDLVLWDEEQIHRREEQLMSLSQAVAREHITWRWHEEL